MKDDGATRSRWGDEPTRTAPPSAHLRATPDGLLSHSLAEHLFATARLAGQFAERFGSGDWAALAGLWHDLGKFQPAFQRRLIALNDPAANGAVPDKAPHAVAGAVHAIEHFRGVHGDMMGHVLASLIAAHHTGLRDWHDGLDVALQNRAPYENALGAHPPGELLTQLAPTTPPEQGDPALWMRMLFSCLVDADFLDTEAFMKPDEAAQREGWPPLDALLTRLDDRLARFTSDTPVNRIRADVLAACRAHAADPPGLFSLTVPTGGGKTLASLAFALGHAKRHGKRRVIYVIPYTSIIEQTADAFREALGEQAVVEHHSHLEPAKEGPRSRLAAENWDAPVIVTTSVQFFESLFAARTSRVRKLHNIVDSVVVLDEAQLLPADFLKPVIGVIQSLTRGYGVTCVLCTATQPALQTQEHLGFKGLDGVREIMADPAALHRTLKRVQVEVPTDPARPCEWTDLAEALGRYDQVLCIVNRRDDARRLAQLLPADTVHLSALMCGEHRRKVIDEIRRRLTAGEPIRVVSTQLVEAGVDVDFPVVYRALAGLDSIAQAAGRCNREGRLEGLGRVVVFVPPTKPPAGVLRQGADITRQLLEQTDEPLEPAVIRHYFERLYWTRGQLLDRQRIGEKLKPSNAPHFPFATVAGCFRLIDGGYLPVIVRYGKEGGALVDELMKSGPERDLLRKLQRYSVNLPARLVSILVNDGVVLDLQQQGLYVQYRDGAYDERFGFIAEAGSTLADDDLIP